MKPLLCHVPFHFLRAEKVGKKKFSQRFSGNQSGQALIVILAFSAILGAGLLSIYNTAQLSTAKRELVNAADASAYSGASIIAQGLNYTAYTNRAILANNALIGQMMAMRSTLSMSEWYWKTTATSWNALKALTRFIPYVGGVISSIAGAAEKFAEFWGEKVIYPTKVLAEVLQVTGTAAVGLSNQVIWLSQQVHLADSLAGFEPNMIAIAKENAPDAKVDAALHATAFGPLVTLGMFATQFKPKIRQSKRTLGTADGPKDEYLNYVTEVNRNVHTPAYLGGRTLLPNAVGLWIATGCESLSNPVGGLSGAFAPAAGLGAGMDTAVRVVDTFASVLGIIANPIMCLYDRHGGSELVQLDNGKMAWTSIDVMAFKVPLIGTRIPVAGGATMSFTEPGKSKQTFPDAIKKFEAYVRSKGATKSYMGHQVALPADCIEYLAPGTWDMYAVSTNTRTSGNCAVLATGLADKAKDKGLWGGRLSGTTGKVLRSKNADNGTGNLVSTLTQPLASAMGAATSDLEAAMSSRATGGPADNPATGLTNQAPPGVSGGVNAATTGLPNTAGLTASGEALSNSAWMTGGAGSAILGLKQRLNPANFYVDPAGVAHASLGSGPSAAGSDGGVNWFVELILKALGLDGVIDLMKMKVSDGVETPRNESLNKVFNVLADGLPPFFWDVRVQDKVQGAKAGEEEDLVFTEGKPDDYNPRRYNLGPLVYLPLIQDMDKIRTAENLGIGGEILGLPDYDDKRNVMRAIGKARIFFRQPSDQWLNRYKVVVNASLLLPYWQVRNESLSYADKWGLMALDGVTNVVLP